MSQYIVHSYLNRMQDTRQVPVEYKKVYQILINHLRVAIFN